MVAGKVGDLKKWNVLDQGLPDTNPDKVEVVHSDTMCAPVFIDVLHYTTKLASLLTV